MKPISKPQIKLIHTLKNLLAFEDRVYRGALYIAFGVRSSTELSKEDAEIIIRSMKIEAIQRGLWRENRHQHLASRRDMASPEQLDLIDGLWFHVSKKDEDIDRQRALRAFLMRMVHVSDTRFLTTVQAQKVIEAMKAMRGRKKQPAVDERIESFDLALTF